MREILGPCCGSHPISSLGLVCHLVLQYLPVIWNKSGNSDQSLSSYERLGFVTLYVMKGGQRPCWLKIVTVDRNNCMREEIKSRLNSGNVCCYSEVWYCPLLYTGVKLCVILREEHRATAFENWGLRKTFGPNRDEVTGD